MSDMWDGSVLIATQITLKFLILYERTFCRLFGEQNFIFKSTAGDKVNFRQLTYTVTLRSNPLISWELLWLFFQGQLFAILVEKLKLG